MSEETELAWAAGFFDGEGHVRFKKEGSLQIGIGQANQDLLERFQRAVGEEGAIYFYDRTTTNPRHKQFWLLQYVGREKVVNVIERMRPYLSDVKQKQYDEAYIALEYHCAIIEERHRYCKRGHFLEGENLYTYPNGKRMCRTCHNALTAKYKQAR